MHTQFNAHSGFKAEAFELENLRVKISGLLQSPRSSVSAIEVMQTRIGELESADICTISLEILHIDSGFIHFK